jgi:hypothetical protein
VRRRPIAELPVTPSVSISVVILIHRTKFYRLSRKRGRWKAGGDVMKIEKIDHICFAVKDLEDTKRYTKMISD